jgi:carboxymethylenebutenolidase
MSRSQTTWNEHLRAEFSAHSADETVATMVANPRINEVPVMIGGEGKEEVYEFYAKHALPQIPPDIEMVPVSPRPLRCQSDDRTDAGDIRR